MMLFPDVEQVAQDICQRVCEAYKFLPDELETMLADGPVCLVERVGGGADDVTDRALVQVSVWASNRVDAWAASAQIGAEMDTYQWGGTTIRGVWVDQITRDTGDQQIFTDDPDERRVTATYRIDTRRQ